VEIARIPSWHTAGLIEASNKNADHRIKCVLFPSKVVNHTKRLSMHYLPWLIGLLCRNEANKKMYLAFKYAHVNFVVRPLRLVLSNFSVSHAERLTAWSFRYQC